MSALGPASLKTETIKDDRRYDNCLEYMTDCLELRILGDSERKNVSLSDMNKIERESVLLMFVHGSAATHEK